MLCLIGVLPDVWIGWLYSVPIKEKWLILPNVFACHIQYRETCSVSCREVVNPVWKQSEGTIALLPRGWRMSNRSVLKQVCLGVHKLAAFTWFCQKRKIKAKFLWGEILREKMLLNRRGYYAWHRSCPSSHWFMQICGQIQVSPSVVLINKKKKK